MISRPALEHHSWWPLLRNPDRALAALFATPTPNQELVLYEGPVCIAASHWATVASGRISYRWLPRPETRFRVDTAASSSNTLAGGFDESSRIILRTLHDGDLYFANISMSHSVNGKHHLSGRVDGPVLGDTKLDSLVFHLPNFHDFLGENIRDEANDWRGRAELNAADWRITIDRVAKHTRPEQRELSDAGGFAITHVGLVRRASHQSFSSSDAEEILTALRFYLSFCRGIWTCPVLPVGFRNGRRVWSQLRPRQLSHHEYRHSWFSDQCVDWTTAFTGFYQRWTDPKWNKPIRDVLWWYLEGNLMAGAIEGSLILVQAALELLSWTLLVNDQGVLTDRKFDCLKASEKIERLLAECGIPDTIPAECTFLDGLATAESWSKGSQVVTSVRNALVHTKDAYRKKLVHIGSEVVYEAYTVALWLLELTLLRVFGHHGNYHPRFINTLQGSVRPVPWISMAQVLG